MDAVGERRMMAYGEKGLLYVCPAVGKSGLMMLINILWMLVSEEHIGIFCALVIKLKGKTIRYTHIIVPLSFASLSVC